MSLPTPPRRFGQVIRLRKDCVEQYKACHAHAWPEVLKQIKDSKIEDCEYERNITHGTHQHQRPPLLGHGQFTNVALEMDSAQANCVSDWYCFKDSIWYDEKNGLLFASMKYVGNDFDGDMRRMAENPKVREWWKMTDSYQETLLDGAVSSEAGPWWKTLEEVFYLA